MKNNLKYIFIIFPSLISKLNSSKNKFLEKLEVSSDNISNLLLLLKKHCLVKANSLISIHGIDNLKSSNRFSIVYNLLNTESNLRFYIYTTTDEYTPVLSISNIFKGALWYEREVWDMFGVYFLKNNDLRRILTDYGFMGHPLRKDFPQSGFKEVKYSDDGKYISWDPIELSQDFRKFNFSSPWLQVK